ncbi:MAG: hypothetical protein NC541_15095 [bacterium]|nr:hypothetical protein [bacterium]
MSYKKLDTPLFSAWNTYAVSMMSVLEDCGMWNKEDTFQKFMGVTGIAAQLCIDTHCSALPVTDYDWITEHPRFLERIGVKTRICYASPDDPAYEAKQALAIDAVKKSLDQDRAAVVWGIDTGEFGIIDGYDDEDGVFFTKGIGSPDSGGSMPILYANLGKTFSNAPVLYVEIPDSVQPIDRKQVYYSSLKLYAQEMTRVSDNTDRAYGINGYDLLLSGLKKNSCDSFGLRYCMGIYYERKEAMLLYLREIRDVFENQGMECIIDGLEQVAGLYRQMTSGVLAQGTDGWNHLWKEIDREAYPELIRIVEEIKEQEMRVIDGINQFGSCQDVV